MYVLAHYEEFTWVSVSRRNEWLESLGLFKGTLDVWSYTKFGIRICIILYSGTYRKYSMLLFHTERVSYWGLGLVRNVPYLACTVPSCSVAEQLVS